MVAGGGPAARPVVVALVRCALRTSWQLLQELSKERVVEFVSPASRADQEAFFSEPPKILSLKFCCELVNRHFLFFGIRELAHQFEFLAAELSHIGAKLLSPQLLEESRPDALQNLPLIVASKRQLSADECEEIRVPERFFVEP